MNREDVLREEGRRQAFLEIVATTTTLADQHKEFRPALNALAEMLLRNEISRVMKLRSGDRAAEMAQQVEETPAILAGKHLARMTLLEVGTKCGVAYQLYVELIDGAGEATTYGIQFSLTDGLPPEVVDNLLQPGPLVCYFTHRVRTTPDEVHTCGQEEAADIWEKANEAESVYQDGRLVELPTVDVDERLPNREPTPDGDRLLDELADPNAPTIERPAPKPAFDWDRIYGGGAGQN